MPESRSQDAPTLRQLTIPMVLLAGLSQRLLATLNEAALSVQVLVSDCTLQEAANIAAQVRPLVIVLTEQNYRFDPESFDHLARDVGASLLRVPNDEVDAAVLGERLAAAMLEAEQRRAGWAEPG
ncbi:MAG: hypothetical protein HY908_16260 [Myxococcales bacterium]|nr:hypothetical protein [Myxococcales bacterium]MCC6524844.1 hypothetical protein [Polyangiaceae bacterium]